VNFQKDLPSIPLEEIPVQLRLREKIRRIIALPGGQIIPFEDNGEVVQFSVPRLETLAMFSIILG
jgi:hypothetical protein